ncbi:MAG: hypothetical protein K2N44_08450 [Lachnospiraceae bacterium]|nr:hypothetical protein [Lachnospiraceae bacterium]
MKRDYIVVNTSEKTTKLIREFAFSKEEQKEIAKSRKMLSYLMKTAPKPHPNAH